LINSYKAGEKMPGNGWISLHRRIQEHWIWQDKPFSKGQAWIEMMISVISKSILIMQICRFREVGEIDGR